MKGPTSAEKNAIRLAVYQRDRGLCQLQLHKRCSGSMVLPYRGNVFVRAHLVHIKSRGAGGSWELSNLLIGCPNCHLGSVHTEDEQITVKGDENG
jgi:5-methylcytosine-specific restriction endonuclease McrA